MKSGLQGGRFASESVAGIDRNQWPLSIGIGGRLASEYADMGRFIVRLSEASIPTRYPENLSKVQKDFKESIVKDILDKGRVVIAWIKTQL